MMDTSVTLALIALATVFVTGAIIPSVVAYVQYRIRKAERIEDIKRQDKVADAVTSRNAIVDSKLEGLHDLAQGTHGLVNSRMSIILQSLHDALIGQMESLRDNIELRRKNGNPPTEDAIEALNTIQKRINDINILIAGRAAAAAPSK